MTIPAYQPICKPNQVICGTGQIVVVTGWLPKEVMAKRLQPHQYAAIGNLYSPSRGIDFLVRNLLANAQVRAIVMLNSTKEDRNAGSVNCLRDFLSNGFSWGVSDTGKDCWVVDSKVKGYIGGDIPEAELRLLLSGLQWSFCNTKDYAVVEVERYAGIVMPTLRTAAHYPLKETMPEVLPGARYGHRIEGKTIAEAWVKLIHRIKTTGTIRPTGYDGYWQELIDMTVVVTDEPPGFYFPEPNFLPCDRDYLQDYIPQILEASEQQEGVKYTYGDRLRRWFGVDQVEQVINKLVDNINYSRAVMSLWDVDDHNHASPPCLNHIWVRVVDGELSLTATFRSNDMFSAWPINAMGLRALQVHIIEQLNDRSVGVTMGPLITVSQSAHIYDDCWDNAERLIANQYANLRRDIRYHDDIGNFEIEQDGEEILVTLLHPQTGEAVRQYRGKHPLKLLRQICDASPAINPAHAGYLGIELQKAAAAIDTAQPYRQDHA